MSDVRRPSIPRPAPPPSPTVGKRASLSVSRLALHSVHRSVLAWSFQQFFTSHTPSLSFNSRCSANATPRGSVSEQPAAIGIMFDIEDVPELGPSLVVKLVGAH